MGKNDVRTAIQQFYTPPPQKKLFYTPKQISGYAPARFAGGGIHMSLRNFS